MARNLSDIAKTIITKNAEGKSGKYSFSKAIFSALSSRREAKKKLKGFLKAGYFANEGKQPIKRGKHKDFFCSYLVAWALQGAEARKTIDRFNELNEEKIQFPDLTNVPEAQQHEELSKWAKGVIKKFGTQLEDLIEIDLDAKTTSPARLHDFIAANPQLFEQVGIVYQKPQE